MRFFLIELAESTHDRLNEFRDSILARLSIAQSGLKSFFNKLRPESLELFKPVAPPVFPHRALGCIGNYPAALHAWEPQATRYLSDRFAFEVVEVFGNFVASSVHGCHGAKWRFGIGIAQQRAALCS